jgi:ribosome biogenesis GTPase
LTSLFDLGFGPTFQHSFDSLCLTGAEPARVAIAHRDQWSMITPDRRFHATLSGKLRDRERDPADRPVAGDWVAVQSGNVIAAVLPRASALSRRAPGAASRQQVIAANVDTVFVVTSCTRELNPRRLERYVTAVWDGGASPVVVLNKADLADDPRALVSQLGPLAAGLPVAVVSARDRSGAAELLAHIAPGRTVALVGSSGVGKSSIINWLCDRDAQRVTSIRDGDDKGRHTTTRRELLVLPAGGILIDTPGMRELGLWLDDKVDGAAFPDIAALADQCRFRDCTHAGEPGCAVLGRADPARLASYNKLQREAERERLRADPVARKEKAARWKVIARNARQRSKLRGKS